MNDITGGLMDRVNTYGAGSDEDKHNALYKILAALGKGVKTAGQAVGDFNQQMTDDPGLRGQIAKLSVGLTAMDPRNNLAFGNTVVDLIKNQILSDHKAKFDKYLAGGAQGPPPTLSGRSASFIAGEDLSATEKQSLDLMQTMGQIEQTRATTKNIETNTKMAEIVMPYADRAEQSKLVKAIAEGDIAGSNAIIAKYRAASEPTRIRLEEETSQINNNYTVAMTEKVLLSNTVDEATKDNKIAESAVDIAYKIGQMRYTDAATMAQRLANNVAMQTTKADVATKFANLNNLLLAGKHEEASTLAQEIQNGLAIPEWDLKKRDVESAIAQRNAVTDFQRLLSDEQKFKNSVQGDEYAQKVREQGKRMELTQEELNAARRGETKFVEAIVDGKAQVLLYNTVTGKSKSIGGAITTPVKPEEMFVENPEALNNMAKFLAQSMPDTFKSGEVSKDIADRLSGGGSISYGDLRTTLSDKGKMILDKIMPVVTAARKSEASAVMMEFQRLLDEELHPKVSQEELDGLKIDKDAEDYKGKVKAYERGRLTEWASGVNPLLIDSIDKIVETLKKKYAPQLLKKSDKTQPKR